MKFMQEKDTSTVRHTRHKKWKKKSVYTTVDKETIINYIGLIKTDGLVFVKYLKELDAIAKQHKLSIIVSLTTSKKWNSDADFFKDYVKFINTLINKSPELADAITENLPDNYNFYSGNLNVSVSTFMLYLGRIVLDLGNFIDNASSLYDVAINKKETLGGPISKTIISRAVSDFNYLELTNLTNGSKIDEIIDSIGNYPSGNNLNKNIPESVKNEIINGILGDSKIGKYLTGFLSSFKTGTDHSKGKYKTHTRNKNVTFGFAGNPIYYIRKIIADVEISGFEKRKLERKKLELKTQYLKEKSSKEMDSKKVEIYKKQIDILEEKIARLDNKEKAFIDKLERKN